MQKKILLLICYPQHQLKIKKIQIFKKIFNENTNRRMSYLEEYAGPLLFLCSNSSSYVNGFNLLIDGGMTST